MEPGDFAPLEGVELETALRVIERAGLERADFVLEERRTDREIIAAHILVHKIIRVRTVATGMERQYGTGRSGAGWPSEFERDLRQGLYSTDFPAEPGVRKGVSS